MRRLFCFLSVLFALLPTMAFAQQTYSVKDVMVEASASDATAARMQAMNNAEIQAFTQLLAQMLPPEEAENKRHAAAPESISRMVQSFDVKSEKISGNSYSASFDIHFDAKQISAFLTHAPTNTANNLTPPTNTGNTNSGNGYVYSPGKPMPAALATPAQPTSTLILPILQQPDKTTLWEAENQWRTIWNQLERTDKNAVRLPLGDAPDQATLNSAVAGNASLAELNPILVRYQVDRVLLAIATPKETPSGATLALTLKSIPAGGNATTQTLLYQAELSENMESLMTRAARETAAKILAEQPKDTENQAASAQNNRIALLAPLAGTASWIHLRNNLSALPATEKLELSAISYDQADIMLYFSGTPDMLKQQMLAKGFSIQPAQGYWVIRK